MKRRVENLKKSTYDLLVIGGGINGASIAYIAASMGLKTALIDKGDFASGTSSKSSKLVHGGIRYLESFQFKLVREALIERFIHLKEVPHLVRPMPFVIPVYKGDKRPFWIVKLGVFLYDLLSFKYNIRPHRNLTAEEVIHLEPGINREGLKGGVLYYDAQMDDARLCLENVLSAYEVGVDVANYVEVKSFAKHQGRTIGAEVKDLLDPHGASFTIRAEKTICAVGPWTNKLLKLDSENEKEIVRTTKGVHIVYPEEISKNAFLIPSPKDNRVFFVIPWNGNSLIGTTDTDYSSDPDDVRPEKEDIQYLMNEAKRVFPGLKLDHTDTVSFAGLRPLIKSKGHPSKVSREHMIHESKSGVSYVAGGKYTTYRRMAFDCLKRLIRIPNTQRYSLYSGGKIMDDPKQISEKYGVDLEVLSELMSKYGARYKDVLNLTKENSELKERIHPDLPMIKAQIKYSIDVEMAIKEEDIVYRRLSVGYNARLFNQFKEDFNKVIKELL